MTEKAVVIAGGGPTGMMLAAELKLAGSEVVVVERRATQEVDGARAGGLHARTIEVLDQRGVADRFLAEGRVMQTNGFAYIPLDISDLPSRRNHGLGLLQAHIERILAGWIEELGVPVLRARGVVGFAQDGTGVDVELSDGSSLRAGYLVGCDGGRSTVRRCAGIDFPGVDASTIWLVAEAEMAEQPQVGPRPEGGGIGPATPGASGGPYRIVLQHHDADLAREPTLQDVRDALGAAYGTDFRVHSPTWISRFTDAARQAATYRAGRVLLAGDAAHIHSPHSGQGLNLGVQDAVNLGWKLAQVVRGTSPAELLDTYHAERHPVGARVLQLTMAQVAMTVADERHRALHAVVRDLLGLDQARRHLGAALAGLDIRYDMGCDIDGAHPLLGRRMPDLDLQTAGGPARVFELLHGARPLLLDLGAPGGVDIGPWADRVRVVRATAPGGDWELPALGAVPPPRAVLVRPDGHVAWTGDGADAALPRALETWFGAPEIRSDEPGPGGT